MMASHSQGDQYAECLKKEIENKRGEIITAIGNQAVVFSKQLCHENIISAAEKDLILSYNTDDARINKLLDIIARRNSRDDVVRFLDFPLAEFSFSKCFRTITTDAVKRHLGLNVENNRKELVTRLELIEAKKIRDELYSENMISREERDELVNCGNYNAHSNILVDIIAKRIEDFIVDQGVQMLQFLGQKSRTLYDVVQKIVTDPIKKEMQRLEARRN